jgi:hypothetical protein
VKLEEYLDLIYRGRCPVCGKEWESIQELHGAATALPCHHRLSMSMPQGYMREKGAIGAVGVKVR